MGAQMRTYKITAPDPAFKGQVGPDDNCVVFAGGVATIQAPAPLPRLEYDKPLSGAEQDERNRIGNDGRYRLVAYFRSAGYTVEDITQDGEAEAPKGDDAPPPARNASTDEWRTYMVATGRLTADEAAPLGRDQLAERYEKKGAQA